MSDFDDTDELPTTSEVFEVPDDVSTRQSGARGGASTTPLAEPGTRDLGDQPPSGDPPRRRRRRDPVATAGEPPDETMSGPPARGARFAGARRRALLWDAGWCLVAGVVVLVLGSAGRPVAFGPSWATTVAGGIGVAWAIVLAVIAAGGVSRAPTALVGLVNLLVGSVGFLLAFDDRDAPTLLLVLAAQVIGFGLVQVVASVRR